MCVNFGSFGSFGHSLSPSHLISFHALSSRLCFSVFLFSVSIRWCDRVRCVFHRFNALYWLDRHQMTIDCSAYASDARVSTASFFFLRVTQCEPESKLRWDPIVLLMCSVWTAVTIYFGSIDVHRTARTNTKTEQGHVDALFLSCYRRHKNIINDVAVAPNTHTDAHTHFIEVLLWIRCPFWWHLPLYAHQFDTCSYVFPVATFRWYVNHVNTFKFDVVNKISVLKSRIKWAQVELKWTDFHRIWCVRLVRYPVTGQQSLNTNSSHTNKWYSIDDRIVSFTSIRRTVRPTPLSLRKKR